MRGIAVSLDGPPLGCRDPFAAGYSAVMEAALNVACAGGEPLALTDCLNFGNPEKPEIGWELEQAIEGISRAAEALGIPVVSGNVSLYNETGGSPIPPTPVVGCVGLVRDVTRIPDRWQHGDRVVLLRGFGHGFVHFIWRHAHLWTLAHDVSDGGVGSRCAKPRPGRAAGPITTPSKARASSSQSPAHRVPGTTWSNWGRSPDVRRLRSSRPDRDVARLSYFGLYALQHRGQESAGIAVSEDGRLTGAARPRPRAAGLRRAEPPACTATSRSATPATRRPAGTPGRTRSRSSTTGACARSRSATTATS